MRENIDLSEQIGGVRAGSVEIEVLTNGGNFSDYPLVREDPVTEIAL